MADLDSTPTCGELIEQAADCRQQGVYLMTYNNSNAPGFAFTVDNRSLAILAGQLYGSTQGDGIEGAGIGNLLTNNGYVLGACGVGVYCSTVSNDAISNNAGASIIGQSDGIYLNGDNDTSYRHMACLRHPRIPGVRVWSLRALAAFAKATPAEIAADAGGRALVACPPKWVPSGPEKERASAPALTDERQARMIPQLLMQPCRSGSPTPDAWPLAPSAERDAGFVRRRGAERCVARPTHGVGERLDRGCQASTVFRHLWLGKHSRRYQ